MEHGARPTVFVIDDNTANLRVFERVFRKRYTILTASTGPAAFALIREAPVIDVALVDFVMPDMDAAAVLAELRRSRPEVVRFLLTGYGELVETKLLQSEGLCRAILSKPWDRETIEAAVDGALTPQAMQRHGG